MGYKEQIGTQIWLPVMEGDKLEGVITDMVEGEYGMQLTIKDAASEVFKTPSHKALQARIIKAKIGQKILIEYTGSIAPTTRGYAPTKLYKVFLDE